METEVITIDTGGLDGMIIEVTVSQADASPYRGSNSEAKISIYIVDELKESNLLYTVPL